MIATVDSDGVIKAVGEGECVITFSDDHGVNIHWKVIVSAAAADADEKNPNTVDRGVSAAFTIAGAMIAGFGAIVAKVKGFGSRH